MVGQIKNETAAAVPNAGTSAGTQRTRRHPRPCESPAARRKAVRTRRRRMEARRLTRPEAPLVPPVPPVPVTAWYARCWRVVHSLSMGTF